MTVGKRKVLVAAAAAAAAVAASAEVAAVEEEVKVEEEDGRQVSKHADKPEESLVAALPSSSSSFIKSFKGGLIPK